MRGFLKHPPATPEEIKGLQKQGDLLRKAFAKADAIAWQAMAEVFARSQGGILILFSQFSRSGSKRTPAVSFFDEILPLTAAAGDEKGFPARYQIPPELVENEDVFLVFQKEADQSWSIHSTPFPQSFFVQFYSGHEPLLENAVTVTSSKKTLGTIEPDQVTSIEVTISDQ